ncbi:MFS transporter [Rodentibacter caecimuris]|uniref:MFS transporter n=1 Tax=Rodentibacter caecimuris TaxID=1796644 RepID=A0AAJ3K5G0_9PAST|nr:MFS transporter [Rodentibacter heylii]AOF53910.1 putative inner membrane protein [Pasteurellaceae bacterium NI1060]OOF73195.1 MFS transporter [Rodentibacter heylii]OOF75302.1 MFS transporter [Rodentibacter heylii]OOF75807.1 MFS transporter [Rodentibacter heylii]
MNNLLQKFVDIKPNEIKTLAWSWLYVFTLFLAYYSLRPIRDELGATGGVRNLPWLFTGTLIAMLVLTPCYAYLVKCWKREKFIAIAYRFFMLNLLIFAYLMYAANGEILIWTGRIFFIWVSVFNLFVVSVFWSLMSDVFSTEQSKRLFGLLTTGATLGGMTGSAFISGLADNLSQYVFLTIALLLLEIAVQSAKQVSRLSSPEIHRGYTERVEIGGSVLSGLTRTFQSPYLLGISAFILCYSMTSTVLYFQQAEIVNNHFLNRAERTAFFANIDLWVNGLTLIFQLGLTGRMMKYLGILPVLAMLPLLSSVSFAMLAIYPTVAIFVIIQVTRRVSNFAFTRPAREVLFTRLNREDRYKAKNVIDTVIYRTGDQIGSWSYAGLNTLSLSLSTIAWISVPLCLLWLALSIWLAKQKADSD